MITLHNDFKITHEAEVTLKSLKNGLINLDEIFPLLKLKKVMIPLCDS